MNNFTLTDDFYNARYDELKNRVNEKRLEHIEGVALTAQQIADAYGVNPLEARLAGLLHDWDKDLDNNQIVKRAYELNMESELDPWVIENMPLVLHGYTASKALSMEFPEIPKTVIDAIYKHTTASTKMSDLDKVLYVSDAIEPSRNFYIVDELRNLIGKVELSELYFQVYKFWTIALIENNKALHPDTIKIWNTLIKERTLKPKQ